MKKSLEGPQASKETPRALDSRRNAIASAKQLDQERKRATRTLKSLEIGIEGKAADPIDMAFADVSNETTMRLRVNQIAQMRAMAAVEEAIRKGRYGICEICEAEIPSARLRAVATTMCVGCAEKSQGGAKKRTQEEHWEGVTSDSDDEQITMVDATVFQDSM